MVNFTFFEVHLHDAEMTANAPFSGPTSADERGEEPPEMPVEEGSQEWFLRVMALAAVLGFLAVLVAWRLLGGDEETAETEDDVSI
jgi:hypothetical protein